MKSDSHRSNTKAGKHFRHYFLMLFGCFCLTGYTAYSQGINLDSLLAVIKAEKNDSVRFYLAFSGLTESETNPTTWEKRILSLSSARKIMI